MLCCTVDVRPALGRRSRSLARRKEKEKGSSHPAEFDKMSDKKKVPKIHTRSTKNVFIFSGLLWFLNG